MFSFLDFCAGIGSAHFAFKKLDCHCLGYSEIDVDAESTYKFFHGSHHKNYGDVMTINPDHLPNFDIAIAGFPCQTFSIIGKRDGLNDARGQIINGLHTIIQNKKPKAFLLENVKVEIMSVNNSSIE